MNLIRPGEETDSLEQIPTNDLEGLLQKVERALKLRGDHVDILKIRTDIIKRRRHIQQQLEEQQARLKEQQLQHAADQYAKALVHQKAFDYGAAINSIQAIPQAFRTVEMHTVLRNLESDRDDSELLIRRIFDDRNNAKRPVESWSSEDLDDLDSYLRDISRAIELTGDRDDLCQLKSELTERRKTLGLELEKREHIQSEAKILLERGRAKEALDLVESAPNASTSSALKQKLELIVRGREQLRKLIAESKEDGVIDPHEVRQMMDAVLDYLKLNPADAQITDLGNDLAQRIKRNPKEYIKYGMVVDRPMVENFASNNSLGLYGSLKCPLCGDAKYPVELTRHFELNHCGDYLDNFVRLQDLHMSDAFVAFTRQLFGLSPSEFGYGYSLADLEDHNSADEIHIERISVDDILKPRPEGRSLPFDKGLKPDPEGLFRIPRSQSLLPQLRLPRQFVPLSITAFCLATGFWILLVIFFNVPIYAWPIDTSLLQELGFPIWTSLFYVLSIAIWIIAIFCFPLKTIEKRLLPNAINLRIAGTGLFLLSALFSFIQITNIFIR